MKRRMKRREVAVKKQSAKKKEKPQKKNRKGDVGNARSP